MYCKNCGKEINDNAAVCVHCGVATQQNNQAPVKAYHEEVKCKKCGYIGEPNYGKYFRTIDWVIGLATIWFGFGILYFIIIAIIRNDKEKRGLICPQCGAEDSMTHSY